MRTPFDPFDLRPAVVQEVVVSAPRDADGIATHRPFHRLIRRILLRKGVPQRDREDVHQDVIMAVIERARRGPPPRSMSALVAGVCFHKVADYFRNGPGAVEMDSYDDAAGIAPPDSQRGIPGPDKANLMKERARELDATLARMEPELRDVFVLIEIEEMTAAEAAEALGITEGAARSRRNRARERFDELVRVGRKMGGGRP